MAVGSFRPVAAPEYLGHKQVTVGVAAHASDPVKIGSL